MERKQKKWTGRSLVTPIGIFTVLAMVALVLFALDWNGPLLLLAVFLLIIVCGQGFALLRLLNQPDRFPQAIAQLLNLSQDKEISEVHSHLAESLEKTSQIKDPIFRQLATPRLEIIVRQTQTLSEGTIEYSSTESWRVAYEQLLRSPGLHLYRSVAHIESAHYWQDGPGQQSTKLNLELHDSRTISIERIAIIADHLWPESALFPDAPIHAWLDQQHRYGIWIALVRESQLRSEPELLSDFGIYGSRAVGIQVADPAGRTQQFVLSFDFDKVTRAEVIWARLSAYSISFRELLDRQG